MDTEITIEECLMYLLPRGFPSSPYPPNCNTHYTSMARGNGGT